jgi:glutamine amidotransferase
MLGILPGVVSRLRDAPRLPHIGWNRLAVARSHPVLAGLPDGTPAYFVHSYAPVPADPSVVVATTEHGGRFVSLVAQDRTVGFQFHPERSGEDGLRMLANLVEMVAADRERARPTLATVGA